MKTNGNYSSQQYEREIQRLETIIYEKEVREDEKEELYKNLETKFDDLAAKLTQMEGALKLVAQILPDIDDITYIADGEDITLTEIIKSVNEALTNLTQE